MATDSDILTWKMLWTEEPRGLQLMDEEPGGLQFMGSQRAGHD